MTKEEFDIAIEEVYRYYDPELVHDFIVRVYKKEGYEAIKDGAGIAVALRRLQTDKWRKQKADRNRETHWTHHYYSGYAPSTDEEYEAAILYEKLKQGGFINVLSETEERDSEEG